MQYVIHSCPLALDKFQGSVRQRARRGRADLDLDLDLEINVALADMHMQRLFKSRHDHMHERTAAGCSIRTGKRILTRAVNVIYIHAQYTTLSKKTQY